MSKKNTYSKKRDKDIFRYLSGDMSNPERNSFERDMERDPFLADAVDGMSDFNPADLKSDLANLSAGFETKGHKRTPVYYRIAAAVIVLLGISSILLVRQLKGPELVSDNVLSSPEVSEEMEVDKSARIVEDIKEDEALVDKNVVKEEEIKAVVEIVDDQIEEDLEMESDIELDKAKGEDMEPVPMAQKVKLQSDDSVIGLVRRENTDISSALEGKVAGVEEEADLNVRAVAGAAKRSKAIAYEEEELMLEEVVEIAATDYKKESVSDVYIKASPEAGNKEFREYIDENIQFPEEWQGSDREVVRLKFKVRLDGRVADFEVLRSPDTLFSKEAIRLIKEGPLWNPASINNTLTEELVSLRIVFRR